MSNGNFSKARRKHLRTLDWRTKLNHDEHKRALAHMKKDGHIKPSEWLRFLMLKNRKIVP